MNKKPGIRNYSSQVPSEKSIASVEKTLVEMGASHIAKEYKDGAVHAISFSVMKNDTSVPFKLPANKEAVKKVLIGDRRRPTHQQIRNAEAQAERTAWKNLKEWVELQAFMIKLEQVEIMEIFMPYLYDMNKDQTMYELWKDSGYKQLAP